MLNPSISKIARDILQEFRQERHNDGIGLWVFKYYSTIEQLKTWGKILLPAHMEISKAMENKIAETTISYGEGTIGYLLASRDPVIVSETERDPRATVSYIDRIIGQTSAFCYPIETPEHGLIGVLDFFHKDPEVFTPDDMIELSGVIEKITKTRMANLAILHEREIREETRRLLATIPSETGSLENLLWQVKNFLHLKLPMSLIVYEEKETKNQYNPMAIDFDNEFLKAKFLREAGWCSYKSLGCKSCPLHFLHERTDETKPCLIRAVSSEVGGKWYTDNGKLLGPYSIAYYSRKQGTDIQSALGSVSSILRNYIPTIEGCGYVGRNQKICDEVIATFADALLYEGEKEMEELLTMLGIQRGTPRLDERTKHIINDEIAPIFLLREENNALTWSPRSNKDLIGYSNLDHLKFHSSIKPLYYALSGWITLGQYEEEYKPLAGVHQIECKIDPEHTIRLIDQSTEIKWRWERGSRQAILYMGMPAQSFLTNRLRELCLAFHKEDMAHSTLGRLLDMDADDPLEIVGQDKTWKLSIYSRHSLTSESVGRVKDIKKDIESYASHAHSLHRAILERQNAYKSALNSAVSSIMSRNMAHHFGSHVHPRTSLDDIIKRLRELRGVESSSAPTNPDEDEWRMIKALRGRLDDYTVDKESFIAEITSEPLTTTKKAVFYRDVILPLIQNTLFMDNIAANEGIQYTDILCNRLKIRVFRRIGDENREFSARFSCQPGNDESCSFLYPEDGFQYTAHCDTNNHDPELLQLEEITNSEIDMEVELPGPLGDYALYGFLENVIRNSAKHNQKIFQNGDESTPLEIYICISQPDDERERQEYYTIEIWDNVTDPKTKGWEVKGDIYPTLHEVINAFVRSPIITESGQLERQAWGFAEMKIVTSLLAGYNNWEQMENSLQAKMAWEIEDCRLTYDEPEKGQPRLVYQFRVMKAKKLCTVLTNPPNSDRIKSLKNRGIWVFQDMEEFESYLKEGASAERKVSSLASFQFVLFDCTGITGEIVVERIRDLMPHLPFRVIAVGNESLRDSLPISVWLCTDTEILEHFGKPDNIEVASQNIMTSAWQMWLRRWENDSIYVHMYLEQDKDSKPTKQWLEIAQSFNSQNENLVLVVWADEPSDPSQKGNIVDRMFDDSYNEFPIEPNFREFERTAIHIGYDRHNGIERKEEKRREDNEAIVNDWYFHEIIEKQSSDFIPLFSPHIPQKESNIAAISPFELAEAGLLRILVIDERMAEKAGGICVGGVSRGNYASRNTNISICTHFGYNASPEPLHREVKKEENERGFPSLKFAVEVDGHNGITLQFDGNITKDSTFSGKFDMVIIHQGVLETHVKTAEERRSLLEQLSTKIPFIMVDSGRGIPPEIQENKRVKFLPFSLLHQCLLGYDIAKLRLTTVAMQLTRRA